mmetsp:Transcript_21745/g.42769  ORF Transcript_21745/g.42769 Transcript_21745/m.42769 type:complete len:253 (-) Transcript_21745:396-1154(-)
MEICAVVVVIAVATDAALFIFASPGPDAGAIPSASVMAKELTLVTMMFLMMMMIQRVSPLIIQESLLARLLRAAPEVGPGAQPGRVRCLEIRIRCPLRVKPQNSSLLPRIAVLRTGHAPRRLPSHPWAHAASEVAVAAYSPPPPGSLPLALERAAPVHARAPAMRVPLPAVNLRVTWLVAFPSGSETALAHPSAADLPATADRFPRVSNSPCPLQSCNSDFGFENGCVPVVLPPRPIGFRACENAAAAFRAP